MLQIALVFWYSISCLFHGLILFVDNFVQLLKDLGQNRIHLVNIIIIVDSFFEKRKHLSCLLTSTNNSCELFHDYFVNWVWCEVIRTIAKSRFQTVFLNKVFYSSLQGSWLRLLPLSLDFLLIITSSTFSRCFLIFHVTELFYYFEFGLDFVSF